MQRMMIPVFRARLLSEVLTDAGIVHDASLLEGDLHEAAGAFTMIPAGRELEFQRMFVRLTMDRPDLWFAAGARQTLLSYGLHGVAAMSAPTLHEYWQMVEETQEISISFNAYHPLYDGGVLVGVEVDDSELPESLRAYTLYMELAATTVALREMSAGAVTVRRIELPLPRPADIAFLEVLDAEMIFDASRMRIFWQPEAAAHPLPHGNAFLYRHYLDQCRKQVDSIRGQDLAARILTVLATEALDLPAVARKLNMSDRTLQRRLTEAGLSFRALSNDALIRRAKELLAGHDVGVAEIAARLGYAETASFTRAFQRSVGLSPRQFRKSQGGPTPDEDSAHE